MSKDIITFDSKTDLMAFDDLDASLDQVLQDTHVPGFEKLLRMARDGSIAFGADGTLLGDARVAINPFSIQHGYVWWSNYDAKEKKKNEILGEIMVPAIKPKPMRSDLPSGDWKDQIAFHVLILEGEGRGEQLFYKVSSTSGLREAMDFIRAISAQRREAKAAGHMNIVPICRIKSEPFPTNFGTQYKPVWKVEEWVDNKTDLGTLYVNAKQSAGKQETVAAEPVATTARRRRAG